MFILNSSCLSITLVGLQTNMLDWKLLSLLVLFISGGKTGDCKTKILSLIRCSSSTSVVTYYLGLSNLVKKGTADLQYLSVLHLSSKGHLTSIPSAHLRGVEGEIRIADVGDAFSKEIYLSFCHLAHCGGWGLGWEC